MSNQPVEKLQPGSWTSSEVRDMKGLRFRLADGREGTVRADGPCYAEDDTVEFYAVEFVPDQGATIVCNKQDFQGSEILPGPPLSDEARERLPALGTTETLAMIERLPRLLRSAFSLLHQSGLGHHQPGPSCSTAGPSSQTNPAGDARVSPSFARRRAAKRVIPLPAIRFAPVPAAQRTEWHGRQ
jgi:hypothetical protein